MLPVNFDRMCTMGTATIWKYIMFAWSYEHGLAIPKETDSQAFTGGLSRLLTVGYVPNVLKLDYNSLYPSIILTFGIKTPVDISDAMPAMLDYVLTNREKYKELKSKYGKEASRIGKEIDAMFGKDGFESAVEELRKKQFEADGLSLRNDKLQLPLKITGNSYFGAFGSGGGVFYWADMECAEETTCSGRQMLRLMLKWFTDKGYQGIVCDSVTEDTPLFVRKNGMIDIKPIGELFGSENIESYPDGREYDRNEKDYEVLCRSGWVRPSYIYRHNTDKDVYKVTGDGIEVDATRDHSLFDADRNEIKPTEISRGTKLETYSGDSLFDFNTIELLSNQEADSMTQMSRSEALERLRMHFAVLFKKVCEDIVQFFGGTSFDKRYGVRRDLIKPYMIHGAKFIRDNFYRIFNEDFLEQFTGDTKGGDEERRRHRGAHNTDNTDTDMTIDDEKKELFQIVRSKLGAPIRKVELTDDMLCDLLKIAQRNFASITQNFIIEYNWMALYGKTNLSSMTNQDWAWAMSVRTLDLAKQFSYYFSKEVGLQQRGLQRTRVG